MSQISDYHRYKEDYLLVDFVTVQDYLEGLEAISKQLSAGDHKSLTYLAAAVSDFYLPMDSLSEHKIQSRELNTLEISLEPVPKLLGHVKSEWNPQTHAVSFKLETDEAILEKKARGSIEKYDMDLVVANLLQTARSQCIMYPKSTATEP